MPRSALHVNPSKNQPVFAFPMVTMVEDMSGGCVGTVRNGRGQRGQRWWVAMVAFVDLCDLFFNERRTDGLFSACKRAMCALAKFRGLAHENVGAGS